MISSLDESKCTGCKLCGDLCPVNAISFETGTDGCWFPVVDTNVCVGCARCRENCPALHPRKSDYAVEPVVYAVWSKDDEVRMNSTSGGIYYELANAFLNAGGLIAGCVFSDDYKSARHIIGDSQEDLLRIMGSKYFQSDAAGIYFEVQRCLASGKKVLFCGTPCQVAALKTMTGEHGNLYTADFICKGINSPKAYRAYLEEIEQKYRSKVKTVRQKSKLTGWESLATHIVLENGREYHKDRYQDWWIQGYTCGNLFMRESCQSCQYKNLPRQADLTFGDFWGIKGCSDADMKLGISVMLVNSPKGQELFDCVRERVHSEERSLKEVLEGNPYMFGQATQQGNRKLFFDLLDTEPFSKAVKRSYTETPPQKAKRLVKSVLKHYLGRKKW